MTDPEETPKRRWPRRLAAFLFVCAALGLAGYQILTHPRSPLPPEWNPTAPLVVSDPVTPLTPWKLRHTANDTVACLVALGTGATGEFMPPLEQSDACHIRNRVRLSGFPSADIAPIETSCAVALRTAMWVEHGLQPAAAEILGTSVSEVREIGSYNCRQMRTTSGNSGRWSTHATAEAIDITGFRFANGQSVTLLADWQGEDAEAQFLRAARDTACTWFATTLGPEFNRLHADHFHLQSRGWGTCR